MIEVRPGQCHKCAGAMVRVHDYGCTIKAAEEIETLESWLNLT